MPSFFTFQQGAEPRGPNHDSSPLLGRFRAVPRSHRNSTSILSFSPTGRSLGIGYGSLFANRSGDDSDGDEDEDDEDLSIRRRLRVWLRDLWLEPKQAAVARAVQRWWARWFLLAVLPALLVSAPLFATTMKTVC